MAEQVEYIQVQAALDGYASLKDNTLRLNFYLQEVPSEQVAAIARMNKTFGYLVFSPTQVREVAIPDFPEAAPAPTGKKTQSQRLRASLYRLWEARAIGGDFEEYYRKRMEHMILWVQGQIEQGDLRDNDSQG